MSSSRARLCTVAATVEPFAWHGGGAAPVRMPVELPPPVEVDTAAIERDAFLKGYQQGERAGLDAAAVRGEEMLVRLSQSVADLQVLRTDLLRRTERQIVELAVAIARKVVHRELSLDPSLMLAMARVALDRLADTTGATVRLNPHDYAAAVQHGAAALPGGVKLVADQGIPRGGCTVQSEAGVIDLTADLQLDEAARVLIGDVA
jgi:flagellar assembly protein FliH